MPTHHNMTPLTSRSMRRLAASAPFDVVIVPGAMVYADGSPSPALVRRSHGAVFMVQRDYARTVMFTGCGGGPRPEAEVGAALAIEQGLDPARVLTETASSRTAENAQMCASLSANQRVAVLTDAWHVARSRLWFRRYIPDCQIFGLRVPTSTWQKYAWKEAGKLAIQFFERRKR